MAEPDWLMFGRKLSEVRSERLTEIDIPDDLHLEVDGAGQSAEADEIGFSLQICFFFFARITAQDESKIASFRTQCLDMPPMSHHELGQVVLVRSLETFSRSIYCVLDSHSSPYSLDAQTPCVPTQACSGRSQFDWWHSSRSHLFPLMDCNFYWRCQFTAQSSYTRVLATWAGHIEEVDSFASCGFQKSCSKEAGSKRILEGFPRTPQHFC